MRSTWTDSRLDDLNVRVTEVRDEVRELRAEVHSEFGALKRTMIQVGGGLIGTLLVGMLGLVATQL
jgi:hypothetical protein